MTLPTKEDIEHCIKMMGQEEFHIGVSDAVKIAERLKGLLKLYEKEGILVDEVDIHWRNADDGQPAIHTYNMLSSEEGYDVTKLRAYVKVR